MIRFVLMHFLAIAVLLGIHHLYGESVAIRPDLSGFLSQEALCQVSNVLEISIEQ